MENQTHPSTAVAIPNNNLISNQSYSLHNGMQVQNSLPSRAMSYSSHAEKRANHNAVERQRRETLNLRFMELAHSIPSLVHVRKPTKSVIVTRSIEFIQDAKTRLESGSKALQRVRSQNEELKNEINRLRAELGRAPMMFPDVVEIDGENSTPYQPTNHRASQQFTGSSSFRTGSPFEMVANFDDDDEESNFGSFIPKSTLDMAPSPQYFSNNHQASGNQTMNQSLLAHALQDIKPPSHGHFQQTPTPAPTPPPFSQQHRFVDQAEFYNTDLNNRNSIGQLSHSMPINRHLELNTRANEIMQQNSNNHRQSPEQYQGFPMPTQNVGQNNNGQFMQQYMQ